MNGLNNFDSKSFWNSDYSGGLHTNSFWYSGYSDEDIEKGGSGGTGGGSGGSIWTGGAGPSDSAPAHSDSGSTQ